jgi:hypothetical protein
MLMWVSVEDISRKNENEPHGHGELSVEGVVVADMLGRAADASTWLRPATLPIFESSILTNTSTVP